jgi:hypothetical protein
MYSRANVVYRLIAGHMAGSDAATYRIGAFQNENSSPGFGQRDSGGETVGA